MSYNKPYFLIQGKSSGKIESRRYYTVGGSNCKNFFPNKCRIDGKLEDYKVLNSTEFMLWDYNTLKRIKELADNIYGNSPDFEEEGINQDQLSFTNEKILLETWKKCKKYKNHMENLKSILQNHYNITLWQDWYNFGTSYQSYGYYVGLYKKG